MILFVNFIPSKFKKLDLLFDLGVWIKYIVLSIFNIYHYICKVYTRKLLALR